MSLTIAGTKTALAYGGNTASFQGSGGVEPYTYSLLPNGAGGSIDASSGLYTSRTGFPDTDPKKNYETIVVTDAAAATAQVQILVGDALLLVCEIIQNQMGLARGRVFLMDQKVFQPSDNGLFVAVFIPRVKPFSNGYKPVNDDWAQGAEQFCNVMATLDINVISRDNSALFLKEKVLMSLGSVYSQKQQEENAFLIGKTPAGMPFTDLSAVDGAAIPFRYVISVNVQYMVNFAQSVDYFDNFQKVVTTIEP